MPSAVKTKSAYKGLSVAVKPMAEPSSGPVQGDATKVASTPEKNEDIDEGRCSVESIPDLAVSSSSAAILAIFVPNSKRPNKLRLNTNKMMASAATKSGSCS